MVCINECLNLFHRIQYRLGFFVILCSLISSSCDRSASQDGLIVARAGSQYLYQKDLIGVLPPGLSEKDSLIFTKNYIDNWAREEILIEQATFDQGEAVEEIDQLVANYKRSLIKQRYIDAFLEQNLDTLVSEAQLEKYYRNYQANFILKETIVRFRYIRVSTLAPKLEELIERLEIGEEEDMEWLEEYSLQFSKRHYFKDERWIPLSDIVDELPVKEFKRNLILEEKGVLQFEDVDDLFLLKIVDYAIKDEISPLAFVKDRVRSLILHQRKLEITNSLEDELFQRALKEDKFELYYEHKVD